MKNKVLSILLLFLISVLPLKAQRVTAVILDKSHWQGSLKKMLSYYGISLENYEPRDYRLSESGHGNVRGFSKDSSLLSLTLKDVDLSLNDIKVLNKMVCAGGVLEVDLRDAESDSWDSLSFCGIDERGNNLHLPLRKIVLPRDMKRIPPRFAANLTELGEIIWPDNLEEIQDRAFIGNTALTMAHIPEGVVRIGTAAFAFCSQLEALTFPSTLQKVCRWSFVACPHIRELIIPHNIEFDPYTFYVQSSPTTITVYSGMFTDIYESKWVYKDYTEDGYPTPGHGMTHIGRVVIPQDFVPFQEETHYRWLYESRNWYYDDALNFDYIYFDDCDICYFAGANSWRGYIDYSSFVNKNPIENYSYAENYGYSLPSDTELLRRKDLCNRIGMLFYNADTVEIHPNNSHFKETDGVLYDNTGTFMLRYSPQRQKRTFQIPNGVVLTFPCFPIQCSLDTLIFPQDGNIRVTHGSPVGIMPLLGKVDDYRGEKEDSTRNIYKMHKLKAMIFPSTVTEVSEMAVSFFHVENVIFHTPQMPLKTAPAVAWCLKEYEKWPECTRTYDAFHPYDPAVPTLHMWDRVYGDFSEMGTWTAEYSGKIYPLSDLSNNVPKMSSIQPIVRGGDGFLMVSQAAGRQVDVYSVSGTLVTSRKMAGPSERIYLKGGSVYIVRVDRQYSFKVSVY